MQGRIYTSSDREYKYGFNTQEEVDEIAGKGNHTTSKCREYDNRTGRRWNFAPNTFAYQNTYATNNNIPILFADPLGLYGYERRANRMKHRASRAGYGTGPVYETKDENGWFSRLGIYSYRVRW